MTAYDLGYGTTMAYMGGPTPIECSVWRRDDGTIAFILEEQLIALVSGLYNGNDEAAYRLGWSVPMVKHRLSKLYRKLGVTSKWEAAAVLGWVHVPQELLDASSEATGRDNPVRASGGRLVAEPHSGAVAGAAVPTKPQAESTDV